MIDANLEYVSRVLFLNVFLFDKMLRSVSTGR